MLISCYGEPYGHYCWGHIAAGLYERGRVAGMTNSQLTQKDIENSIRHRLLIRVSKAYYGGSHFDFKGKILRKHATKKASRLARLNEVHKILHITTLDMPAPVWNDAHDHFVLIDSTWNSWFRCGIDRSAYTKRLMCDIENLDSRTFREAAHIFTLAEYVKEDLVSHYGISAKKISTVGTGPGNMSPFFGEEVVNEKTILFVARVRFESKGGTLLLEAFQKARLRDPEIRLVLVGGAAPKSANAVPGVTVKDYVSREELQTLFQRAAIFAMPATNEPWGLVYLEAMVCRTPILGLARNALPEMTDNGRLGFLVSEADPDEIAEVIVHAMTNMSELRETAKTAQQFVLQKYSWEKTVDCIERVMFD